MLELNRPELRRVGLPGGGGIASAAEVAMFYQPLVNRGETADGTRILKAETIDYATTVRTRDDHLDPVLKIPANRGLSIIVAGADGHVTPARFWQSHLAARLRPRRRRRANGVGRSGQRYLGRVLHQRIRGLDDVRPPHHGDFQPRRELRA